MFSMLRSISKGWNEDLVRSSFSTDVAFLIISIPCTDNLISDYLVWHYDKWGSYSVKSGYRLGFSLALNPSFLGLSGSDSWWKYLWRTQIPVKVKLFLWRACHDWVHVYQNLVGIGVVMDSRCPICKGRHETNLHALWCCPMLKLIRVICQFMKGLKSEG
ncbi:hypothetical protein Ddye_024093 [Dipteronia dyeriana]|uniref:Reverse transcriptase zinc-binding domain-containing protein n=1 Tax=Dipteronia dyeriana TaxID=168575 RepID=A0AAD9WU40_9ROSI|nr:hypothetical protein Ddye_024093 [Dipteronia dyeriana]